MNERNEKNLKVMGLMEHLDELRGRIFRSLIAVVIIFGIAFSFANYIFEFLKGPLVAALPEGSNALHFTGPMDVLIANIKISFLAAVVGACPFWLYQFWKFLEPALYEHEKKYAIPFLFSSVSLFFSGVAFCFFVIMPLAMEFLIQMGMEVGTPIITVADYVSVLMLLIFGFGLVFETPVILVLLALLDLVDADMLAENRKFVLVGVMILGALLTPPDPISQIAMGLPTYLMFEMSIVIIRLVKRKRKPVELEVKN
ncbi:twin-arginine translocase subunit TatC [Pseudobacteriovorax antillogorgiicola]|uniref:Sec-independent protein translocase protein TatC n=1 Tax=Pseudobacteriovorax antillogorgiicola TaxID=1513793 RepID=A0A1Y6BXE7_9BACT|nr:twin-arginine translocase subunit TatC [Pseudobacteriovorax antillogorgiicola]TCS50289.1 sec-independent protein translocase protein TatC [Pseudobacteriovorax antillogorgiicola]SMF33891.1 sec-independent protein translocase protein TatC [Pseudobacteriovorax antillogorgiicola]